MAGCLRQMSLNQVWARSDAPRNSQHWKSLKRVEGLLAVIRFRLSSLERQSHRAIVVLPNFTGGSEFFGCKIEVLNTLISTMV